ncbi:DsbA family protein [Candidatus Peregrinibacteria bacterium]|jgi:protein-disulfide isomerase|nr:DsbA family protein [Candidatus Peregrinibacteria bacterium]MBT7736494.1 DsbA family protein [Candidatus Peregrinibacteria bacterium]
MATKKVTSGLMASIIFASVIVSGSLVYFGMKLGETDVSNDNLQAAIATGIDQYVEDKQKEYDDAAAKANAPLVDVDLSDDDAILGDTDAPVTIVEFSDYQCPYCEKFWSQTLPDLKKNYIDTGKVRFIYRDWPLSGHDRAIPAALATECVKDQLGDEGFYAIHDMIFENFGKLSDDDLSTFAKVAGVDEAEYLDCYESQKFLSEIEKDFNDGMTYGVTGTPGFFVNGVRLSGAQPYEVFEKVIEEELAK